MPETATISVSLVWDDADNLDGIRPDTLTVNLLADGEVVATVELNDDNDWSAFIENLPVYKDGEPIVYTWDEGVVDGYTANTTESGFTSVITNTHDTERTVATVIMVWDDDNNRDGIRPASITMTLSTGVSVVLNEDNRWTGTIRKPAEA